MTPELNEARAYLRTAQHILHSVRGNGYSSQHHIRNAEYRVLAALDLVWQAQYRAVFEEQDDVPHLSDFINRVDWPASEALSVNPEVMVIRTKKGDHREV